MTAGKIVGALVGFAVTVLTVLLALFVIRFFKPAAKFGGIAPREQDAAIPDGP